MPLMSVKQLPRLKSGLLSSWFQSHLLANLDGSNEMTGTIASFSQSPTVTGIDVMLSSSFISCVQRKMSRYTLYTSSGMWRLDDCTYKRTVKKNRQGNYEHMFKRTCLMSIFSIFLLFYYIILFINWENISINISVRDF